MEALQYYQRPQLPLAAQGTTRASRATPSTTWASAISRKKHAETEELAWSLQQFRPQLLMMHTRAVASETLKANDFPAAIRQIDDGIARIREFYHGHHRGEMAEQAGEINALRAWLDEISAKRPLSTREKLERALNDAVNNEDYEKAAQVRDAIRNLNPPHKS